MPRSPSPTGAPRSTHEGARAVADSVTGALDPATVLEVAQAAAGKPLAEAAVTECRSIYWPRVAGTLGVYGVAGAGRVAPPVSTESPPHLAWDAVLKVLAPVADGRLPFEASLYASGVLAALPGPLVAPRCYGVTPQASGGVGVWLERVLVIRLRSARAESRAGLLTLAGGSCDSVGPMGYPFRPLVATFFWRCAQHAGHSTASRATPPMVCR